jgi:preprotein translocase subunit SecE
MARQTRSERRARRAAQAESKAALERNRARPAVRPAVQPAGAQDGARAAHAPRRFPGAQFVSESWAELKKVEWPGQQQLIQGTVVVLIACLIVGVYLFLADQAFKRLVQHILLRTVFP